MAPWHTRCSLERVKPQLESAPDTSQNRRVKQPRIVVLDDQSHMHDIYDLAIKHCYPNASIVFCFEGDEAVTEIRRETPDLVITDLNHRGAGLPELSKNEKTPVIVISGLNVKKVDSMGSHVHFLPKPFRLDSFCALLRHLLTTPA